YAASGIGYEPIGQVTGEDVSGNAKQILDELATAMILCNDAVQVLYINLATDGLPALAVGIGPPDPDVMERQVQKKGEPTVFSPEVRRFIIWILAAETPLLVLVYLTGVPVGVDDARTRLFLAFVFVELIIAFNCSSLRFPINKVKPHKWLVLSVVWEAILVIVLLQIPQAKEALHLVTPTLGDVEWTAIATVFTFAYIEALKHLTYRRPSDTVRT
ncbi:MAG: cation-translocating P-type ATPase C-terminal domain-containing protein, partial [Thaumarchaeota archaeon]|nr:cation-translocating P-type ATPase C-terminal domain-containing protein [Nitrososphaerota archaeon]